MSRTIYLIRHAMPDIPLGERWCVGGRTDLPLGPLGRLQAALLPFVPELRGVSAVFCSPLIRAIETAQPLCPSPIVVKGLEEQDMGVWDGLPFTEIRRRWPELYEARERQPELLPEGAEPWDELAGRVGRAVLCCLKKSEGNIAVVSHKSSIAALTGRRSALSYTSLSVLRAEEGELLPGSVGVTPHPELTDEICLALLEASGADRARIAHCRAVAEKADALCAALVEKGVLLDAGTVHRGALLHDLAKGHPEHAALGGVWLRELGYPAEADIVRQHTEPDGDALDEAGLVFLADKAVRGDKPIGLTERFAASLEKCRTPEAVAAHTRRREAAFSRKEQLDRLGLAGLIKS